MNIDISQTDTVVQVSYFGSKSNQIKVVDGDEIEITNTRWWKFSPFLFSMIIVGIMLISEMQL